MRRIRLLNRVHSFGAGEDQTIEAGAELVVDDAKAEAFVRRQIAEYIDGMDARGARPISVDVAPSPTTEEAAPAAAGSLRQSRRPRIRL